MTQPRGTNLRTAATAFGIGLVTLLVAGELFGKLLIPEGAGPGIWAVWGATVAGLTVGVGFALRDVLRLRREIGAINQLPSLGGIDDYQNNLRRKQEVFSDTLIADRVNRVAEAKALGATADAVRAGFRSDANSGAGAIGMTTRYLASTLLLLSVIGTFAGMKAALPGLYSAVQQSDAGAAATPSASPRVDLNGEKIHDALKHVADAFGANFLALIGALTLSIFSFGATSDRRRVLVRLERVSEQRLYPFLHSERELVAQAFVDQLKESVHDVGTIATQIEGLRQAIADFTHGTTTVIETFQSSLNGQIRAEFLSAHRDIAEQVGKVVPELTRIATASNTTAVAYEGLVQGLRERDLGLVEASKTLRTASADSAVQIKAVIEPLGDLTRGITGATAEAHGLLGLIAQQTQLVNESVRAAGAAAVTADDLARTSAATIEQLNRGTDSIVELANKSGSTLKALVGQGNRLERVAEDNVTDLRRVAEDSAVVSQDLAAQANALIESNKALREVLDGLRTGVDDAFTEIERRLKDRELYTAVQSAAAAQTEVAKEVRELVTTLKHRDATIASGPTNGTRRPVTVPDAEVPPTRPAYEPPPRSPYVETGSRSTPPQPESVSDTTRRSRSSVFNFWKGR